MTVKDETELTVTRNRLRELEERYVIRSQESPRDAHVHALTLQSLKRVINQLKEEIARFESRHVLRG